MSCEKHPIRKRQNCPHCFPDAVVPLPPSQLIKVVPESNLEELEPVIKKTRKPRVNKAEITVDEVVELKEEVFGTPKILVDAEKELSKIKQDAVDILAGFKEKMNAVIVATVTKAETERSKLLNIRYEYLQVDEDR
jgi:hypothetical protein